jgi:hypothetical protein
MTALEDCLPSADVVFESAVTVAIIEQELLLESFAMAGRGEYVL